MVSSGMGSGRAHGGASEPSVQAVVRRSSLSTGRRLLSLSGGSNAREHHTLAT